MSNNETIIIDTPDGIAHMRFVTVISALNIEVKTGMKMSRGVSALKIAQSDYGCKARTKAGALTEMLDLYIMNYGRRSKFDTRGSQDDVFCPDCPIPVVMNLFEGNEEGTDEDGPIYYCGDCGNGYICG